MNAVIQTQQSYNIPTAALENDTHTASKHVVACEAACKAYLHAMYGFQPSKEEFGVVTAIAVNRTTAVIEIRFILWGATALGMFELPLYVFKQDGNVVESTALIRGLAGRGVTMTVAGHYSFNGVPLSRVVAVDFKSPFDPNKYGGLPASLKG
jgi:hypothetical protein